MYGIINDIYFCQRLSILFASLIHAIFCSVFVASLEIADVGLDSGQVHHRQALLATRSADAQEATAGRASVGAALGDRRWGPGPASHRQTD